MSEDERLDRPLGHRVTATAERILRHLATDLADEGMKVGKASILDALIKDASLDRLRQYFRGRGGSR